MPTTALLIWPFRSASIPAFVLFGHVLLLGLSPVAPTGKLQAAVLEGTEPKDYPANPENHQVHIERLAANETEAALITAAEAARPKVEPRRDPNLAGDDEPNWWHREQLGIRIPYALTSHAIDYYRDLIEGYAKATFGKRYMAPSSRLGYTATVRHHPRFEHQGNRFSDVHVVTLKLEFEQNFAASVAEGFRFTKERLVVLNAAGEIVAIFGDGPTEAPIFAI